MVFDRCYVVQRLWENYHHPRTQDRYMNGANKSLYRPEFGIVLFFFYRKGKIQVLALHSSTSLFKTKYETDVFKIQQLDRFGNDE